jgi:membrane protease YdiL (CAAX protease family)
MIHSETTGEEDQRMPERRERLIEVSIFLFLIVPSMVLSFFAIKTGSISFGISAVATILRDLALVSLILFFLWHNRESVLSIGWTLRDGWREVGIGILLFFPVFYGAGYLDSFLQSIGFSAPATSTPSFLSPQGAGQFILALALVIVVAISEETIFRGYLILRFEEILKSPTLAVLLSGVVFSLGHGYEGTSGAITVGAMGIAFAIVYLWRKSLIAPIVMHFLQDFVGIILIPILGMLFR